MATHSVAEAYNAVWTGSCDRHDGEHPLLCGAEADLAAYRDGSEAIESWYLD